MHPDADDEAVKRNKARFCILWKSGVIVFLLGSADCPPKGTDDKGVFPSLSMAT